MYRHLLLVFAALWAAAGPMAGQTYERRATIVGGSQGKCTVEVVVDGIAEVEIRGDRGFLRNLAGQAPQWRRFECAWPLPVNPVDFQFSGVDGRGTQQLIRDPRNGGAAVVRISDSQGGAEAYTFDIRWSGGSTYSSSSPSIFDNTPYSNQRVSTDEAIRLCQDSTRQEAAQRFNTSDIEFRRTIVQDNRGRRDLIAGTFAIRNSVSGLPEVHRFSCSMNFNNGSIQSVQIDQQQPYQQRGSSAGRYGYYGDRGASVYTTLARACEQAVTDRIRRDGYQRYSFGRMNMENGDSVIGSVMADRGNVSDSFDFTCAVNRTTGRVRSVQVNRR